MWDHWKKKIKRLFADNEQEQHEAYEQHTEKSHLEAKMMYQYPAKKPFRFPVIPDVKEEKNQSSELFDRSSVHPDSYVDKRDNQKRELDNSGKPAASAYQESLSYDAPAFQRRRLTDSTYDQRQRLSHYENKETKVYKKDPDMPFRPTEVPSPIYGFGPRDDKRDTIERIPAYKRKKEATVYDSKKTVREEKKTIEQIAVADTGVDDVVQDESLKDEMPQPSKNMGKLTDEGNDNSFVADTEQQKRLEDNPTTNQPSKRKASSRRELRKSSEESIPYNVMMTPRDKKNLFERTRKNIDHKKEEKQENQEKNTTKEAVYQQKKAIPIHLLNDMNKGRTDDTQWMQEQQRLLEQTLKHFNVRAKVVNVTQGPSVTRFEVHPELGVKVSKVKNLSDDLKLNMAAKDIRIEAPIPGKNTIGIEIPNRKAQMVGLQEVFETAEFIQSSSPLTIALGLTIEGKPLITNIQKMPHGLIAGATGSGKSVCINTILISLLFKAHYDEVKFLLIDPKMVELAPYNGIPHLVSPVITDVKAATAALKWAVAEMEERYEKFVHEGVRDIERYNEKMEGQNQPQDKLPFIVIVIDELADLMMISPQDVEDAISRIAQKARACGIHLILATQRPSVDVITGLIKANIPTRIAFSVSSQVDSRTILDTSGAEKLLGKGDMLFIENGTGKSVRLQGPFVSDEEIDRVANYVRGLAEPNYLFEQEQLLKQVASEEEEDELLQDAILFVLEQNSASTSLLQRHFKIGYNRAARLIDTLEARGIISGQNGSKPREVLVTLSQVEDML